MRSGDVVQGTLEWLEDGFDLRRRDLVGALTLRWRVLEADPYPRQVVVGPADCG